MVGPLFGLELNRLAGRGRHRIVWVTIAVMSWTVMAITYATVADGTSMHDASEFTVRFFYTFATLNLAAVGFITPACMAGSVAHHKEQGSLLYLLISDLRDHEILCGLMLPRFFFVMSVLAASLPILSFSTWLGGLQTDLVLISYLLAGAFALFLCGLSALATVLARRVRDAVIGTYLAALLVLIVLPAGLTALRSMSAPLAVWLGPIQQFLADHPPAALWSLRNSSSDPWSLVWPAVRNHVLVGLCGMLLAVWSLRSVYLRQRFGRVTAPRTRLGRRPPVSDDPVYWRERNARSHGRLARLGELFAILASLSLPVATIVAVALLGDSATVARGKDGGHLIGILGVGTPILAVFAFVSVAVWAATSISSERKARTLLVLGPTALRTRQIVRGKLRASLWPALFPVTGLTVAWLAAAAVTPAALASLAVLLLQMAAFCIFASVLGLRLSAGAKSSTSALSRTIGILIATMFLPMVCLPFGVGFSPLAAVSLAIVPLAVNLEDGWKPLLFFWPFTAFTWTLYALAAHGLYESTCTQLDRALGRWKITREGSTDPMPSGKGSLSRRAQYLPENDCEAIDVQSLWKGPGETSLTRDFPRECGDATRCRTRKTLL